MKKQTIGLLLLTLCFLLISSTTYATTEWPYQKQAVHSLKDGYIVGGYTRGDDYISPMTDEDNIIYLDRHCQVLWSLSDQRLTGCLFDQVEESTSSVYFGVERNKNTWLPTIMKVSKSDGHIHWIVDGDSEWDWNDFSVTNDEEIWCVGERLQTSNPTSWVGCIWKLSSDGDILLQKSFEPYAIDSISAITIYESGSIVAACTDTNVILLRLNAEGDVIENFPIDQLKIITSLEIVDSNTVRLIGKSNIIEHEKNAYTDDYAQCMILQIDDFTKGY